MLGYARSEDTRFASGADVVRGWQTVHDRYQSRYNSPERMGRLAFSGMEVSVLAPDAAVVFGRWELERKGEATRPAGLFTLVFRRIDGQWRIVADHTSSAAQ
jgi:ketosteroid isomerase-like protein